MYGLEANVIAPVEPPRKLVLRERAWARILEDIRARYPIEACGAMFGRTVGSAALVEEVRPLRNVLGSPRAFWIDVVEWMSAVLEARKRGLEYIGLYHSHAREEPMISLSDRQRMLECPGEVWLIVSYVPGSTPSAAAWVVRGYGLGVDRVGVVIEKGSARD